jgi:hypothetical protein
MGGGLSGRRKLRQPKKSSHKSQAGDHLLTTLHLSLSSSSIVYNIHEYEIWGSPR